METIAREHNGRRVDNYLAKRLKHTPKSLIYKLLRSGQVRVNGGRVKPHYRLATDDEIRIPPVEAYTFGHVVVPRARVDEMERAVCFEDEHFMIVNKPAGLACHTGTGLRYGVVEIIRQMRPGAPRIDLAHRIDRDTSGCLVLSKHLGALREFHDAIRDRACRKRYRALLKDRLPADLSAIEASLDTRRPDGGERRAFVTERGKTAQTIVETCRAAGDHSLVDLRLVTGRMHQIRAHAQYIGHPVAGDRRYGVAEFNDEMRAMGLNRLFLHASDIEFTAFDRKFEIVAELPRALETVLEALFAGKPVPTVPDPL